MVFDKKLTPFVIVQIFTVMRVFLSFIFIIITPFTELKYITAIIYSLAVASDVFDGIIARKYNVTTKFGAAFDIYGDRYLLCISCIYAGFRGVETAVIGIILMRELFSATMKMVQVNGVPVMVANRPVGIFVHGVISLSVLAMVLAPELEPTTLIKSPFYVVACFYCFFFPYTIYKSWPKIMESVNSDLKRL